MINQQIKKNKGPASTCIRQGGFTLVETMFAVFILTSTIVGLMTVVSNSLFAARYARDEITVNYLLQEVVDHIRNDRDTIVFFQSDGSWKKFSDKYTVPCSVSNGGCFLDVMTNGQPESCNSSGANCPYFYYNSQADTTPFYTTESVNDYSKTNFRRKIIVEQDIKNLDEINVTVTVDWQNGNLPMERSLKTSFMKWQE